MLLEYEQDTAAVEAARFDDELLVRFPAPVGTQSVVAPVAPVFAKNSGSAAYQASLDATGMAGERRRTGWVKPVIILAPRVKTKRKVIPLDEGGWAPGLCPLPGVVAATPLGVPSRFAALADDPAPSSDLLVALPEVGPLVLAGLLGDLRVGRRQPGRAAKKRVALPAPRARTRVIPVGSPLQELRNEDDWVWRSPDPIFPRTRATGRFRFESPPPSPPKRPPLRKFRRLPVITLPMVADLVGVGDPVVGDENGSIQGPLALGEGEAQLAQSPGEGVALVAGG